MRATVMYGAGDVRVEEVPDPAISEPTDALLRITRACICGSDLWPYKQMPADPEGAPMGHEFIGVVEDVGVEVSTVAAGDVVVAPFMFSDGTCDFCGEGLHTSCRKGGMWGRSGTGGGQAEAVRVPYADGTLVKLPVAEDDALMPGLLTLSDVFCTGHHAAVCARVRPGQTVAVVGDGAVGLCGVIAAKRLGAERVLILGRHTDRTDLALELGAADVVAERGKEGVERVRDLTGGEGVHAVLECVGLEQAFQTAIGITRPGGAVGRVGVPQFDSLPGAGLSFFHNITVSGGVAPARAYIEELMPEVLEGDLQPGRVFDSEIGLAEVPGGYKAMDERDSIKVMIRP